jgi:hypothetical protein
MRGEILSESALAAERDRGARSIIFMSAARISVSSSDAALIASAAAASSAAR